MIKWLRGLINRHSNRLISISTSKRSWRLAEQHFCNLTRLKRRYENDGPLFSHRRTAHRIFNSSKQSSACSSSHIWNLITIGQILEAFVARSRKLIVQGGSQGHVLNTKLIDSATRSDLGPLSPSVTLKYPKAFAKSPRPSWWFWTFDFGLH